MPDSASGSIRFPAPLRPGDLIAVTSPSSGVAAEHQPRLEHAVGWLERAGYRVRVGECMSADRVTAGTKQERAAELTEMLCDPEVRAVVPPWGGELAIDLLDQLDWDRLAAAEPTWTVGYSDSSTWMTPLTTRLGWATIGGTNLMDTPYRPADGLRHWTEFAAAEPGAVLTQRDAGRYRSSGFDDWSAHPEIEQMTLDAEGRWSVLGGGAAEFSGRLIGGCIECLGPICGTPYADLSDFGRRHGEEGIVVFLEAAEFGAYDVARILHGLRYAGWFEHATGILVGRTHGKSEPDLSQHDAVADALGMLGLPIVVDLNHGHTQPWMPLVNGAWGEVRVDDHRAEIGQRMG